jgi:protein tyrosine phosphatase
MTDIETDHLLQNAVKDSSAESKFGFNIPNKEDLEYYALWLIGKVSSYAQPVINKIRNNTFEINEVCSGVYISDFSSACNVDELKKMGITHIVTAIVGVKEMYPQDFKYYTVDVCDRPYSQINKYFDECADFIDDAVNKNGKVLVHCKCGVSRSTTLIAAYLIKKKNYSVDGAIEIIKKSRNCIQANAGFIQQLKNYSDSIRPQTSP